MRRSAIRRSAIAVGLMAVATCANAHEISESYSACLERAAGVTPAMQECIAAELTIQDKRLNTAYASLLNAIAEKRKTTQLRDVQRKWIAFRDANCAYYDDGSLGQAARLASNECVLIATAARAFELENLRPE